ncbi:MAG: hypothetical protein IJU14_00185 [Clostridia bacterium]|nr:hypothetical protein [Clostridia bacterium]
MKIIFRLLKGIMLLVGLFVSLISMLTVFYAWLSQKGIIKSEWLMEKTPSGRGLRFVMSIRDKVFLSFQI